MFLTHDDVVRLTGKQHYSAQRRALNTMGIMHKTRPDGSVVVLQCHVQRELGGTAISAAKAQNVEPNWGAI